MIDDDMAIAALLNMLAKVPGGIEKFKELFDPEGNLIKLETKSSAPKELQ